MWTVVNQDKGHGEIILDFLKADSGGKVVIEGVKIFLERYRDLVCLFIPAKGGMESKE
jgi:hypothetical protein